MLKIARQLPMSDEKEEAEEFLRRMGEAGPLPFPSFEEAMAAKPGDLAALTEPRTTLPEAQYRTLVEQIPAVTFMASFERGLREVYVSPQIESLLGYSQEEWLESPKLWFERLHPDDVDRWHADFLPLVMEGKPFHGVYRFIARDGKVVRLLGDARIVRDDAGRPLFVQGVGFDVTQLEEAKEELRKKTVELELANKERQELAEQIRRAQEREIARLRSRMKEEFAPDRLLGASPRMQDLRARIHKLASSNATVLITGESGTGKELVAQALHAAGPRARGPFVDMNCAAIPETLLESELFGAEPGAATGVTRRRAGKFEQAHGGTLFLDEIADMPLLLQAKILRVLQERSFERLGGHEKIRVDVRVICATNRNLEEEVKNGTFRSDLRYRINTIELKLPALRDRIEDVPMLAEHFLNLADRPELEISKSAVERLKTHSWPGNVRELKGAMERASLWCEGDEILPEDLPEEVTRTDPRPKLQLGRVMEGFEECERALIAAVIEGGVGFDKTVEQVQRSLIVAALGRHDHVKTRAAKSLHMNERRLDYMMKSLGIE